MIQVTPFAFNCSMISRSCFDSSSFSAAVGSSRIRRSTFFAIAFAISITAGLRHHVEAVADVGRRGDPTDAGIAEREAHAVVGVKEVHLAADDVDLRAFVIEILHLREEIGADVVVVDGEVGLGLCRPGGQGRGSRGM